MKRFICGLLFAALLGALLPSTALAAEEMQLEGNFVKITTGADFSGGTQTGLEACIVGDGALMLSVGTAEGEYCSCVFQTAEWNDLVASWNADTPRGTSVEVLGRAYIPGYDGWTDVDGVTYDGWTDWITWGEWSPYMERGCPNAADSHPRKDGAAKGGWAYAYSFTGYGDSSININEGNTSTAFQLKAVLRADGTQQAQPVLRLLAATFKNTDDPGWQDACVLSEPAVQEAEQVLLDTPSISQTKRDPDYGGVICSATSMTMLLDGQGADLIPEDVALLNFDYGFGGNGNWSFTTAAAGAYGYESYVHYASFEGLRQELSRGYAVALSVRYSNMPNGKYPFLANAPTTTGGHLITIVGFYFSQELGEYVYYSNDPATGTDLAVAHREYRESQLSEAWMRRAAYLVHDKEDGAGTYAREYHTGGLWPVEGQTDVYALVTEDGEVLSLPADFTKQPRENYGEHGTLALTVPNEEAPLADGVRRVTANLDFYYNQVEVTEDGFLQFGEGVVQELTAGGTPPTVYVVFNSGAMYTATAAPDAPVYTLGMEIPTSDESASNAVPDETSAPATEQTPVLLRCIIIAAVVVLALAVAFFVRRAKRK